MRRIAPVFVLGLLVITNVQAQFNKGDVELSFSGSFSSMSYKSSGYDDSESNTIFTLSIIPGYYFLDGFSVEPEIGVMKIDDDDAAFYLLGNLSFTHLLEGGRLAVFGRAGYGKSNSVVTPFGGSGFFRVSNGFDVDVINVGGGTKYLITDNVVLRAEINYRSHKWNEDYWLGEKEDLTMSNMGLLVGFSINL
jgi:opacity protein-like surface antigen